MARYVESIRYEADIAEVKRKLDDLKSETSSVASHTGTETHRMSTAWSGVSSAVGGAMEIAKRAGIVIGAGLLAAGAFGLKSAADFQQTRIAFEGILGSAQTADAFLKQLRDFAAKTPFELPGIADAAKQLLAVGFAADDVLPIMTHIGNVAATLGVGEEGISSVVRALGQMKGKGKASAEELNQISEAIPGFSAIKAIADDMGISVQEAFKKIESGALPADAAIESIFVGMQKFPGAAGAMDRQSQTLNGVISTVKDTFRNALVDGIEPFLPAIANGLTKATPYMERFVAGAVELGVSLVAWIQEHWPEISRITAEVFAQIGQGWEQYGAPTLAAIITAASFIAEWIEQHWPEISRIATEVWTTVSDVVTGAIDVITTIWENFGPQILGIIEGLWTAISGVIEGAMQVIQGIVKVITGIIHGDWGLAWEGVKQIFTGVWDAIVGVLSGAGAIFGELLSIVAEIVTSAFRRMWEESSAFVGNLIDDVVGFFTGLPAKISGFATDVLTAAKDIGSSIVDGIVEGVGGAAGAAVDFALEFARAMRDVIDEKVLGPVREGVLLLANTLADVNIPGAGRAFDAASSALEGFVDKFHLPTFHAGGIVPGAPGSDQLVLAQGGEMVLPVDIAEGLRALIGAADRPQIGQVNVTSSESPRSWYEESMWRVAA